MTRKDYKLIVETLNEWVEQYKDKHCCAHVIKEAEGLAMIFIKNLQKDNPKFDAKKFLKELFK